MDKKDLYIKSKLQQDKEISNKANEVLKKFEGGINVEKNKNQQRERKILKISLNQAILAFIALIILGILGGNLYAHLNGKPNLYSAIKGLFVKEDKYTASEISVDQTVENNGIKLTLKTVAMDENILITKYIAEGEKLNDEFYTYSEFEDDMIEYEKIFYSVAGYDIGENTYKGKTKENIEAKKNEIIQYLTNNEVSNEEATQLFELADKAYYEFIGVQLENDKCSEENAKEQITQTIAAFESKVLSKYEIIKSNDKLQGFNIEVISQKIEKNGNQYIIYNVYNVDTISDLASKFNLDIDIKQIGSINGTWKFSTELEKARLDTRVETIDFYEDNSENVTAYITTSDYVRHEVKVEVKRLVISDFSSVIMIQTDTTNAPLAKTEGAYSEGVPYIFVVTDENGNIVGTGTRSKEDYENSDEKYTDRIILENVNLDTKKLYIKIYEQWDMSELGEKELVKFQWHTIELDVEKARQEKYVELNQSIYNASHGISLKYPGNWTQTEQVGIEEGVELYSPEDSDGNRAWIFMDRMPLADIEGLGNPDNYKDVVKTSITVSGYVGDDYVFTYAEGMKERQIRVIKDDVVYSIIYRGNLTQFERYNKTFEKILSTVSFAETKEEKSYIAYYSGVGSDSLETVKVYEDGTVTVQISEFAKEVFKKDAVLEANKEYEVSKVWNSVNDVVFLNAYQGGVYVGSYIFFFNQSHEFCLLDMYNALTTGNFEAKHNDNFFAIGNPYLKETTIADVKQFIVVVNHGDGDEYVISRDGTVEKYIEPEKQEQPKEPEQPEQPENTEPDSSSKYENMSYKSFEIYNGIVKQYEDNTITVEWNDEISIYENKQWEVKPNIEYTITGIEGSIKGVYNVIKDRQEKNMPTIKILTEDGTLYGRLELKTDYRMEVSIVSKIINVETIVQRSAEYLIVITKNDTAYKVNYDIYTELGKAPTKSTLYNTIEQYLLNDDELYTMDTDIQKAIDSVEYDQKEDDDDLFAYVSVNVNHPESGEVHAVAVVEYNKTIANWEVTSFKMRTPRR